MDALGVELCKGIKMAKVVVGVLDRRLNANRKANESFNLCVVF